MEPPNFPEKPTFDEQTDPPGPRLRIPKQVLIAAPIVLVCIIGAWLLLGGEETTNTPKPKLADNNKQDISNTLEEFYSLANENNPALCRMFDNNVFAIPEEVEAPSTPSTETPSTETPSTEAPSTETPSTETPSTETPSTETPETPSTETQVTGPQTSEDLCASWLQETWLSPLKITDLNQIQEETDQALALYKLSNGELGGAILVEINNVWLLATLMGLRGKDISQGELKGALVEEYEQEGPLYLPPLEEIPEEVIPPQEDPSANVSNNLFCPGSKRFDFVADIRSENFRLFPNQKQVAGGDIVWAKHSLGKQSCLLVNMNGNYRQVPSLQIELSYNSWQASSPSLVRLDAASKKIFLVQGSATKQIQGQVQSSEDGRRILMRFRSPSDWKNSAWSFWFLRSSFSDGAGSVLFDEGRPAGQTPPSGAKNPEGGWPR